jgi:hypothetical protein
MPRAVVENERQNGPKRRERDQAVADSALVGRGRPRSFRQAGNRGSDPRLGFVLSSTRTMALDFEWGASKARVQREDYEQNAT